MPQLSEKQTKTTPPGGGGQIEVQEIPLTILPKGNPKHSFSRESTLKNGIRKPGGEPRASLTGQFQFRKKKEKSTAILVSIVVLFILCHSYRLSLKIYEFAKPSSHVMDRFTFCYQQQRYTDLQGGPERSRQYSILE